MDYLVHLLTIISIYGILTVSLNYIAGYAGILSLSHATFYGVGAYTTAILMTRYDWSFLPTLLLGMILGSLLAWLASFPILKLKNDSLVLVSFGFAIIGYNILLNWSALTKGPLGIKGVPAPEFLGINFFYKPFFLLLAIFMLMITYLIFSHIVRTPYGTMMKGIRENVQVASVNGYHVSAYQRSVFVLGAAFAAIAGSLMSTYLTFIEPKLFDLMPSVILLIMVILGGMGNLKGSILGALLLILIPEALRFLGLPHQYLAEVQQMIYGFTLVFIMFWRPQGIMGEYKI